MLPLVFLFLTVYARLYYSLSSKLTCSLALCLPYMPYSCFPPFEWRMPYISRSLKLDLSDLGSQRLSFPETLTLISRGCLVLRALISTRMNEHPFIPRRFQDDIHITLTANPLLSSSVVRAISVTSEATLEGQPSTLMSLSHRIFLKPSSKGECKTYNGWSVSLWYMEDLQERWFLFAGMRVGRWIW